MAIALGWVPVRKEEAQSEPHSQEHSETNAWGDTSDGQPNVSVFRKN